MKSDSVQTGVPAGAVHHRGQVTPLQASPRRSAVKVVAGITLAIAITAGSVFGLGQAILNVKPTALSAASSIPRYGDSLKQLDSAITKLANDQVKYEITVVQPAILQQRLSAVRIDSSLHHPAADQEITQLQHDVTGWQQALDAKLAATAVPAVAITTGNALNVPILIYHATPADFDHQLSYLAARGYTTITMAQLGSALAGRATLPAKSIVLTFDDGLANQMTAYQLLLAHHMKATYYIINDGPIINTPISRPHNVGGWDYLTWDQVLELDRSGIIEIGSHTMDHLPLAAQTPSVQHFEIFESKLELEAQLGHPVTSFAYPYGSYNNTSVELVRQAGFATAVTTLPGTLHTPGTIFTLTRIRSVYGLP